MLKKYQTKLLQKFKELIASPSFLSIAVITFFSLFTRILGFIRQFLIYSKLEPIQSDLLLSANKVPDFLATFLVMGTVYSSVFPLASKILFDNNKSNKNPKISDKLTSQYLNLVILCLVGLMLFFVILIIIWTEPILRIFTSKDIWEQVMNGGYLDKYILTTRIMCLIPILSAIQAVLGIFITLKKRFLVYSLAGVISNFGCMAGILLSKGDFVIVSIGMVLGWAFANLIFLWESERFGYKFPGQSVHLIKNFEHFKSKNLFQNLKSQFTFFKTDLKTTLVTFVPRIFVIDGFYSAIFLINPLAQNSGQITAFDIGVSVAGSFYVLVSSMTTVALPDLANILHDSSLKREYFWSEFIKYLKLSFFLGLFVTITTLVGSPIVMWLYEFLGKGQGTEKYIVQIAQVSSFSLTFRSIREIMSQYFYLKEKVWEPVALSFVAVIVQVFCVLFLLKILNFDAGIAVSWGLTAYNLIWFVFATGFLYFDYQKYSHKV
jgi:peptidoglycan biosynthesis protein MviN/MurJ (putative lipid II flippase)